MTTTTGYIYKLWSLQSDEIYIGSTKCFRKRKSNHKKACTNVNDNAHNYAVYQHIRSNGGWDAWFMNVIEQVEFTHKWELETREAYHIKDLNASLNCRIPTQTPAEYRQDNRERIAERDKQYRQANREAILEQKKQYRQANRARINERQRQKIECECGAQVNKTSIYKHQRSKRHHKAFYQKTYDFIHS